MNRLRVVRAEKRVSQFSLRLETGVHQSKISLIENGLVEPSKDEAEKLAKALGVSVEEIFPEAKPIPASGKNNQERKVAVT